MIRYRPLFTVDIGHDYFLNRGDVVFEAQADADRAALIGLYSVVDFLELFPDNATRSVLAGHKMLFRATDAGFSVSIQLDPTASDTRPMIPPAGDLRLAFVLRVADPRFANYTELGPASTNLYRFANDSQNRTAGVNFLCLRAPAFDATRRYVAGDAFLQAAAPTFNFFVALRDTGPSATPVVADWKRIPPDTFSATATYRTGALVLSANALFRALVDNPGTDLTNATNWQPAGVLGNQYVTAADATLPITPEARSENWFGVIEIGLGTSDFALLNADGTLRSPRYALRFLNRATRWRYIFPSAQAVGSGAEVAVDPTNSSVLVTPAARPLTRFGVGSRLQADSPATPAVNEEILLPAPAVNQIRRESVEWYSETHVPNITVGP